MPPSPSTGGRGAVARRRAAAREAQRRKERRRRTASWIGVAGGIAAAAAALVLGAMVLAPAGAAAGARASAVAGPEGVVLEPGAPLAADTTSRSGAPRQGIRCSADEQVVHHIHTHLAVFVNGAERAVPAGIGIVDPLPQQTAHGTFDAASRCYYWLHVHARDGVIHIEAPTAAPVMLGSFFAVWGQPLSATRVATAMGRVTAYVDGRRVSGDPRRIVLRAHEDIQLDVGAPAPFHPVDWSRSNL